MKYLVNTYFAQTYGNCSYTNTTYQDGSCSAATSTGTGAGTGSTGGSSASAGGSLLTNTGFDIALTVTLACAIIFIALLVRFWKRPARKSTADSE